VPCQVAASAGLGFTAASTAGGADATSSCRTAAAELDSHATRSAAGRSATVCGACPAAVLVYYSAKCTDKTGAQRSTDAWTDWLCTTSSCNWDNGRWHESADERSSSCFTSYRSVRSSCGACAAGCPWSAASAGTDMTMATFATNQCAVVSCEIVMHHHLLNCSQAITFPIVDQMQCVLANLCYSHQSMQPAHSSELGEFIRATLSSQKACYALVLVDPI
jgi:hypothetical protein